MFKFYWDDSVLRYRDAVSGQFVADQEVRDGVSDVIDQSSQKMRQWSNDLISGTMKLQDWQQTMAGEVRLLHTMVSMAAGGGKKRALAASPGYVDEVVRKQINFLQGFALDVKSRKQPLTKQVVARSELYAKAAQNTFENQTRNNWAGRVFREERWQLGQSEHCPGCVAQAARGWVPADTLPAIGSQQCRTRCHCRVVTRRNPFSQNPCALEPIAAAARR
jgi:hypothetical protein